MRQIRDRFAEIARGEYDIIIGTQLVARGIISKSSALWV